MRLANWLDWSSWLREGYYVSYELNGVTYYEHILRRDLAHYVYTWFEEIESGVESGPRVPDDLVMTQGYDPNSNTNRIWQLIFGIKGQVFIYVELPTDIHRHGVPKVPKPGSAKRDVSHFEEWMSDFHEPEFVTEHFLIDPFADRINLSAYNPQDITITPQLNFFINRMITERIGTEENGALSTPVLRNETMTQRIKERWSDTLLKLHKRQIPFRPITIMPVRAPAGET